MSIPTTMRAVIVSADQTVKVEEGVPVPTPKANEILIKVVSTALNPIDWMSVIYMNKPGTVLGTDFVGPVVARGADVPADRVPIGQQRGGFIRGGWTANGAFAEYLTVPWATTFVAPSNLTALQSSSIPTPLFTSVNGLHFLAGLPDPGSDTSRVAGKWLLVWSGATAVGQFAIQLGKIAGMKVAVTASAANHEKLKSIGADVIFDYRDPQVVQKLRDATSEGIVLGMDCIAKNGSVKSMQQAFGPSGGNIAVVLPDFGESVREDVKTFPIVSYVVLGDDVPFGNGIYKSSKEVVEHHANWQNFTTQLFESGQLKPLETLEFGGLENVQKGMDMMRDGSIPGKVAFVL